MCFTFLLCAALQADKSLCLLASCLEDVLALICCMMTSVRTPLQISNIVESIQHVGSCTHRVGTGRPLLQNAVLPTVALPMVRDS